MVPPSPWTTLWRSHQSEGCYQAPNTKKEWEVPGKMRKRLSPSVVVENVRGKATRLCDWGNAWKTISYVGAIFHVCISISSPCCPGRMIPAQWRGEKTTSPAQHQHHPDSPVGNSDWGIVLRTRHTQSGKLQSNLFSTFFPFSHLEEPGRHSLETEILGAEGLGG